MEQSAVHNLAVDPAGVAQMVATPQVWFNCPTRRNGGPYGPPRAYNNYGGFTAQLMARGDYAACAGDGYSDEASPGPDTLAQGDDPSYAWPATDNYTGVIFQRSLISLTDITNGTSNTFLAGEKYLDIDNWYNGRDPSDNENLYVGFDNDISRSTIEPPRHDRTGLCDYLPFGSSHPGGVNMLYCDGSVQHISFDVDPNVFRRAGNRN
jgi:prepilin-type processing-associated H-X9-DG protein